MPLTARAILSNAIVRSTLKQAWNDSSPGQTSGHEEGGFIVKAEDGSLIVVRWSKGQQDAIQVPPHENCATEGLEIVATFHTHPNTGSDYLQEPSDTDKRAVRDDPDLKGAEYVGEFVVSESLVFLISPAGQVREMDDTRIVFTE